MFEALLERIARGLDSLEIPYRFIGGQAVLLHGEPRLTRDIDVTLGAGPEKLPAVLKWVAECEWKVLVDSPAEFVNRTLVLPCLETTTGIRLDFIFSLSPYERQAIQRARTVTVGNTAVCFASVEDLIIHKFVAGRPRDIEDARSVLLKNPALDSNYVRRWLREFEAGLEMSLVARFDDLLAQSQPADS